MITVEELKEILDAYGKKVPELECLTGGKEDACQLELICKNDNITTILLQAKDIKEALFESGYDGSIENILTVIKELGDSQNSCLNGRKTIGDAINSVKKQLISSIMDTAEHFLKIMRLIKIANGIKALKTYIVTYEIAADAFMNLQYIFEKNDWKVKGTLILRSNQAELYSYTTTGYDDVYIIADVITKIYQECEKNDITINETINRKL